MGRWTYADIAQSTPRSASSPSPPPTKPSKISSMVRYSKFSYLFHADLLSAEIADPSSATTNAVHTTRKVTQPPGGPTSVTISGGEIVEQDALSMAPPRGSDAAGGSGEGAEGQKDEGVTLTHTEKAEMASVTMETDGIER
jgi:hypothetical protein